MSVSASPLGLGVGPPMGSSGPLNGPPPSSDQLLLTLRNKPHCRVFRALFQVRPLFFLFIFLPLTVSSLARLAERQPPAGAAPESRRCDPGKRRNGLGWLFSRRDARRSDGACPFQLRRTRPGSSHPPECPSPLPLLSPHRTAASHLHSARLLHGARELSSSSFSIFPPGREPSTRQRLPVPSS